MATDGRAMPFELVPRVPPGDLEMLLGAIGRVPGGALSWQRHESQQPQDGFARLGLHCALCFDGPCRVSPFANGRGHEGAEYGVCGFDGPGMSMAVLLRAAAAGLAALAPHVRREPLLAAAGELLAAASPGAGTAVSLADCLVRVCRGVAAAIAAETFVVDSAGRAAMGDLAARGQRLAVGLGHLDPSRPRVLVSGPALAPSREALQEILRASGCAVQVVVPAGAGGSLLPGLPTVIDGPSVELLSLARLIHARIELRSDGRAADSGEVAGKLDAAKAAFHARPWSVPFEPGDCTSVSLAPWHRPAGRQLLIAGSSRVRSPRGRGGIHRAAGAEARELGWSPVGLGDAAFYLAQDGEAAGPCAASLPAGLAVALRAGSAAAQGPAAIAALFPEPVQHAELACALLLAAGGIQTHVAGQLPLGPAAGEALTGAFGCALSLGPPPEPAAGRVAARVVLDAVRGWLTGLREPGGTSG
ncbi:MAG: hypothetical protein Q8P31_13600 [Bacillota bacterium]|nr:hypothetical protein [Bacillota bacterium]